MKRLYRTFTFAAICVAALALGSEAVDAGKAPAPCIEVSEELGGKHTTLEGRVFIDESYAHPTRGKTHPFILRLDAPRCAVGVDAKLTELHRVGGEDISLKPLVGKHVRVSGDPFSAHTTWHARPIVLWTTSAKTL